MPRNEKELIHVPAWVIFLAILKQYALGCEMGNVAQTERRSHGKEKVEA
jgi:hypothetical protein